MPVSKGRKKAPPRQRTAKSSGEGTPPPGIGLYHAVYEHESFDDAAEALMQMVRTAAEKSPGQPRFLYLDIDGHRNSEGGFDKDMFELQNHFVLGYLSRWLTTINMPLLDGEARTPRQFEDDPDVLVIHEGGPASERDESLKTRAAAGSKPIYDSDTGEMVMPDGTRRRLRDIEELTTDMED